MAIETKYICDKCGHTQPERDQMWEVAITVRHLNFHPAAVAATGKTGVHISSSGAGCAHRKPISSPLGLVRR